VGRAAAENETSAPSAGDDASTPPIGPVAVIAHRKKSLDGGLDELRTRLADHHVADLLWHEVSKSKKAPKHVRQALRAGAQLIIAWGGDGLVQRCLDTVAGSDIPVGIIPAGTANLLAHNLGIPENLRDALHIALARHHRTLDLGRINGEHFAVMAGVGFDAELMRDVDGPMKNRLGRLAYFWSGLRHVHRSASAVKITIDGRQWFDGRASCVLLGNVGRITGGVPAFDDARPDDGWLDVGVTTADNPLQWARTLGRILVGRSDDSPFVRTTRARTIAVRLAVPRTYELDGGTREMTDRFTARVVPHAVAICVPAAARYSTEPGSEQPSGH
jgi:YegS/Rv2252/BmrU family lipid kinase